MEIEMAFFSKSWTGTAGGCCASWQLLRNSGQQTEGSGWRKCVNWLIADVNILRNFCQSGEARLFFGSKQVQNFSGLNKILVLTHVHPGPPWPTVITKSPRERGDHHLKAVDLAPRCPDWLRAHPTTGVPRRLSDHQPPQLTSRTISP